MSPPPTHPVIRQLRDFGVGALLAIIVATCGFVAVRNRALIDRLSIERIVITELKEGTFYATIELRQNGSKFTVSSRPSDAIALAVRANTPIFAEEDVLSEASILIKSDDEEREVEKFREFLDQISPEDFGAGSGSGGQ